MAISVPAVRGRGWRGVEGRAGKGGGVCKGRGGCGESGKGSSCNGEGKRKGRERKGIRHRGEA